MEIYFHKKLLSLILYKIAKKKSQHFFYVSLKAKREVKKWKWIISFAFYSSKRKEVCRKNFWYHFMFNYILLSKVIKLKFIAIFRLHRFKIIPFTLCFDGWSDAAVSQFHCDLASLFINDLIRKRGCCWRGKAVSSNLELLRN